MDTIPGIETPLALAPMAGVNCRSFRLMCRQAGCGLIYTQMYHADFVCHKEDEEAGGFERFVGISDAERPVALQLVGHNPVTMARAAQIAGQFADIIDINLGCPDDNIVKSGAGAYFACHPEKIASLIKPVVLAAKKPISAKIRIGWDSQNINGVSVALLLQKLGVWAIAVHGRVAVQKYRGKANWEIIRHIREKASVKIIGNGDVNNKFRAAEMMRRTGCDIVMVGRRAMGDPGFFSKCAHALGGRVTAYQNPREQFLKFLGFYAKLDIGKSFSELRCHALWFSKRAALGPAKRRLIMRAQSADELRTIFEG